MTTRDEAVEIAVDGQEISGTLVAPATRFPGVLFVHGWGGNKEQYLTRACGIAALGCVCLTIDLRGHARTKPQHETVTPRENLRDVEAAYDVLASHPNVDSSSIALVGSSYGGYLAAILTSMRPVRWLALRAPALYRDEDWEQPKAKLDKHALAEYRRRHVGVEEDRALSACAAFEGDVLIVESPHDTIVPHPAIESYLAAFGKTRSLTYRIIEGADHGLTQESWQQAYTSLLVNWATEMVPGARAEVSLNTPER